MQQGDSSRGSQGDGGSGRESLGLVPRSLLDTGWGVTEGVTRGRKEPGGHRGETQGGGVFAVSLPLPQPLPRRPMWTEAGGTLAAAAEQPPGGARAAG